MKRTKLHDGRDDGLTPTHSLDVSKCRTYEELLKGMSRTSFGGRQLGEAFSILQRMAKDDETHVVLTLTGAMTVAKQGLIICDLIDKGIVDSVVATGALVAHGLTESLGLTHYKYDASTPDDELYAKGYNRIYDTLEMEENLNGVEQFIRAVLDEEEMPPQGWSSASVCQAIGSRLSRVDSGRGILRSAYEMDVPVFIPAFTDSEMGLDVATWAMSKALAGQDTSQWNADQVVANVPVFNPFLDLYQYANRVAASESLGILTIGGGVPRNWAQQVAPFFDVINHRIGTNLNAPRFRYGVRICPEPVHWGGLSGCSYSEGVSWGKFVPPSEGGEFAEVYSDATVVLPLLAAALFESMK